MGDRHVNYFLKVLMLFPLFYSLTFCSSCRKTNSDPHVVQDRLLNFLITKQLPLGPEDSPLRSEYLQLGDWLQSQLKQNSRETFLLESAPASIVAKNSGEVFPVSNGLFNRLFRLQDFFFRNQAVPRQALSWKRVKKAILSDYSINQINHLIDASKQNLWSETGGVVTLDEARDKAYFLPIKSVNSEIADELVAAGNQVETARTTLENHLETLPFLKVRAQRTIDILSGELPDAKKLAAYQEFLELFRFYSKNSYILGQNHLYAEVAEVGLPGIYFGQFHVHPPANRPSTEDKIDSFVRRNLVIVPLDNGFEVHYLDFTAGSKPDEQVVTYRPHS